MDQRFNQAQLQAMVVAESEVDPETVAKVLRAFYDVVGREVVEGNTIAVTNFGTWKSSVLRPRLVRNPQTGESWMTEPTRQPRFKFSPTLRQAVNDGLPLITLRKLGNGKGARV
jgi:nucleoid DNA-binding protein